MKCHREILLSFMAHKIYICTYNFFHQVALMSDCQDYGECSYVRACTKCGNLIDGDTI